MTFWSIYLRDGIIFLPTQARTEAGFNLIIDPVELVSVHDAQAFAEALKRTIERGNPKIPTPTRDQLSKMSGVEKYANLKRWSDFAKSAIGWSISEKEGSYTIAPYKNATGKPYKGQPGWVIDAERAETLPVGATIDEVVRRTVELVQALRDQDDG